MLFTEAALCCAGAVAFVVLAAALRPRGPVAASRVRV
jgi:hypothetical protein